MEFVALSDSVLDYLARDDPYLRPYFRGVFAADQLPWHSKKQINAYIVNTDPAGQPGQHWLAIWTCQYTHNVCEVFDSYALPISTYRNLYLQAWLRQWKMLMSSQQTLQAADSYTCGHYALFFLKARAQQISFRDFLAEWDTDNLVLNDKRVADKLQRIIKTEVSEYKQTNVNRSSFSQ